MFALQHGPLEPLCARALAGVFTRVGDAARVRGWHARYLGLAGGGR